MQDIHDLLKMLKELDDQLVSCMRCGMCQAVCPVYGETGREADVARGKIALLEGLASEMIQDPVGVQSRLTKCLMCGSCAAACPSGVKVSDIFIKARAILAGYIGLPPAKKAIFRGLLQNPRLMNMLTSVSAKFQGLVTSPVNEVVGSSCSRLLSPVIGDRHILPLAKRPFRDIAGDIDAKAGESGLRVAFFYGCMVDKMFPRIGEACLKVLSHHGVGVYLPKIQACCGIPALASGDLQTYEKLVELNLDYFAKGDFDCLITPCATCTSTIKKVWPVMAEKYPEEKKARVLALAAKAIDVNAFVADKLGVKQAENSRGSRKITIHDPCHLKKSLGVAGQVRNVVLANPECAVTEMAASDACCGCGGSFTLEHYDLSSKIGRKKRDNIVASGAETVVAGCPACMMQISDMLSHGGDKIAVRHPIELYAETL